MDQPAFDVLFTDIGLPGMRGDALAARVRDIYPEMPVIFATGYNDAPELDGRVLTSQSHSDPQT